MQNPSSGGVVRQSALDKAKAAEKAKKLRDEKEAASALEDFVKEFDADVTNDTTTWQAGGIEGGMTHTSSHGAGSRVFMPGRRHFTGPPKHVTSSPLQCEGRPRRDLGIEVDDRSRRE